MKKIIYITIFLILISFYNCDDDTTSPSIIKFDFFGLWKAHVVDGNIDGLIDTLNEPSHVFLLNITKSESQDIDGEFIRIAFGSVLEGNANGSRTENNVTLTISDSIGQVIMTFTIDITVKLENLNETYFVPIENKTGYSGKVVFFKRTDALKYYDKYNDYPKIQNKDGDLVEKGGNGSQAVIFIHGYHSDPSTWNNMIESLLSKGYGDKHKLYTYEYDWHKHIVYNGNKMKEIFSSKNITNPILIAHSMGGMVSRAYISAEGSFAKLITIGTPHFGTPVSALPSLLRVLQLLKINISFISDFTGDGPTDMNWCYYPYIFEQNRDNAEMNKSDKYVLFFGEIRKYYTCYWHAFGECRVGSWSYNHDYGLLYETTYELLNTWGGPNDGVIPCYSATSDVYWARKNNKFEVPNSWSLPYCARSFAGDWDHVNLTLPDKVPAIRDAILYPH